MTARWPIADAYGIETSYCPICREPEPDGLPNVEAFEATDQVMCSTCWEAVCEADDPEEAAERRADEIMESLRP